MDDLTLKHYVEDQLLREELGRAARRERAVHMRRFLEQSARALLGDGRNGPGACAAPCG